MCVGGGARLDRTARSDHGSAETLVHLIGSPVLKLTHRRCEAFGYSPGSDAMRRRAFLALSSLFGAASILPAAAESTMPVPSTQRWFVQVWFDGKFPIAIDPSDYPGRVEITIDGAFVACAWAPTYESKGREMFLVPLSIGATATGRREDIKVEVFGELKRYAQTVIKITAVAA